MMSIPVQCTQEIPVYFHEKPQPLAAADHNPAAPCGIDCLNRNMGTFSNLLSEDMARLSVDMPHERKADGIVAQKAAPLLSLDSFRLTGASSSEFKTPRQPDHAGIDRTLRTTWVGDPSCGHVISEPSSSRFTDSLSCPSCLCQMPLTGRLSLDDNFPNQSGGLLMSDVALQSHVCDFCQAVFPGDTTTRGEFLRHLHTHIS